MRLALREAEAAIEHEDVPIGAVVVRDGEVLATARNERELRQDPGSSTPDRRVHVGSTLHSHLSRLKSQRPWTHEARAARLSVSVERARLDVSRVSAMLARGFAAPQELEDRQMDLARPRSFPGHRQGSTRGRQRCDASRV